MNAIGPVSLRLPAALKPSHQRLDLGLTLGDALRKGLQGTVSLAQVFGQADAAIFRRTAASHAAVAERVESQAQKMVRREPAMAWLLTLFLGWTSLAGLSKLWA